MKIILLATILYIFCFPCFSYPIGALQCYSSLTSPDNKLICPQSRARYCVKEVVNVPVELCGETQYFGDEVVKGRCQFKKCADECVEGTSEFTYNGQTYTRDKYCCNNKNYCNSGSTLKLRNACWIVLFAAIIAAWILL